MRELLIKAVLSAIPQVIANKLAGEFVPVFLLHRITDRNGDLNQEQVKQLHEYLKYIRKQDYRPLALKDLFAHISNGEPLPKKSIAFTVDDGFADQFEQLAPIFSQYDVPLTCFVITGMLDGILWPWDAQVKYILSSTKLKSFRVNLLNGSHFSCDIEQNGVETLIHAIREKIKSQDQTHLYDWLRNLYNEAELDIPANPPIQYRAGTWEQVKKFVENGHSIAAHSKTHRILSRLNETEVREEIIGSYEYLKSKLPECADIFAYPTGRQADFGAREEKIIMESPIIGAVSTIPDAVRRGYRIEALPRFGLPDNMSTFLQYISFIEGLKNKVRKIEQL